MKTITFYSYKGGVGRTLTLSNIAKRLSEFGKRVCVLDFDLEAPGLQVKLENQIPKSGIQSGIVDYIYEFTSKGVIPNKISEYSTPLNSTNKMFFIAAGNPLSNDYWLKLTQINWWSLFYSEKSEGIPFFLDLKEKIKIDFNPDYLLIDSRTGISELSAITISLLADTIVFFAANNKENIQGCKHVLKSIANSENNLFDIKKDIHFVLSRIPSPNKPDEKTKEEALTSKIFSDFSNVNQNDNINMKSFNVIHSDRELEFEECIKIGYDFEKPTCTISKEYLDLFNNLTDNDFSEKEKILFNNIRECEQIVEKAVNEKDYNAALKLFEKAVGLNPNNADIYYHKGFLFYNRNDFHNALSQFNKLIEIEGSTLRGMVGRAVTYYRLKDFNKAFKDLETSHNLYEYFFVDDLFLLAKKKLKFPDNEIINEYNILIEKYPNESNAFNSRSNYLREKGEFESALTDIYKALQLNTENGLAYSTLAEIKASMNEIQEFYRNFELALKYNFNATQIFEEDIIEVYRPFFKDEIFLKLLEKYNKIEILEKIEQLEL